MRAFLDVVEAEGAGGGPQDRRSKALLSKYVRELEDELGALLPQPHDPAVLKDRGRPHATSAPPRSCARSTACRGNGSFLKGREGPQATKLSAARTFADAPDGQSLIDFLKADPDIILDVSLDDRFVDLVEEGFDVAIRISRLENSDPDRACRHPFRCGSAPRRSWWPRPARR